MRKWLCWFDLLAAGATTGRGPSAIVRSSFSRPEAVTVDASPTMPPPSPLPIFPTAPPTPAAPTKSAFPRGTEVPWDPPLGVSPNFDSDCTIKWEGVFSECSVSCGVGVRTMRAVIDRPALPGGNCVALPVQYQPCERAPCASTLSVRSCVEIGWFVPPQWYGSDKVCGASKVQPVGNSFDCSGKVNYDTAANMCLALGARLCTAQELLKDEARFSGCSLDTEMVWANSSISPCSSAQAILSVGASSIPEKVPTSVCVPRLNLYPVRCCADVWSVPCRSNECAVKEQSTNKCFQDGATNKCLCDTILGWTVSPIPGGQTCVLNDPCRGNPCRVEGGNMCSASLATLTFQCVCKNGWRTGPQAQFCLPPTNLCLKGNPCLEGNGNICVDGKNGTYHCECGNFGFTPGPEAQSCVPPRDPCVGEVCFTFMAGNQCIDHRDGSYHCVCRGRNWALGPPNAFGYAQTCIPPPRACVDRMICQSGYKGNLCVENNDGTFHCICNANNWGGTNTTSCKPYRQCTEPFVCAVDVASRNRCIDNRNGTYTCECAQPGWAIAEVDDDFNAQMCVPPPCAGCLTQHRGNRCLQVGSQVQCQCGAKGYTLGQSRTSPSFCVPPPKQCVSPRICSTGFKGNTCTDLGDGTFRCECQAPGWTVANDTQSCTAPPRRCEDISTCSQDIKGNLCNNEADGSYYCICGGPGYSQGLDDASCIPPKPVCVLPSDCSTGIQGNVCQDNQDGTFQCLCNGSSPGKVDPKGRVISCVALKHCVASGPPCWSQIAGNTCIDYPDGSYSCVCNGLGWTIGESNHLGIQSCVPPPRICEYTTACRTDIEGNACIERDGAFYCACNAEGWSAGPGSGLTELAVWTRNRPQSCVQRPESLMVQIDQQLLYAERNCTEEQYRACGVDNGNTCHGRLDGTYKCSCVGFYFLFEAPLTDTTTSRFRRRFAGQCILHPCLRFNPPVCGGNNTCVPLADGQFECRCSEPGWSSAMEPSDLVLSPPLLPSEACVDDPEGALRVASGLLLCADLLTLLDCSSDVSLISAITARGFALAQLCPRSCNACPPGLYAAQNISTRVRGCLPPEKWCAVGGRDPCVVSAGNICVDLGLGYYCVCLLPTWIAGPSRLSLPSSSMTYQETPPGPLSCVYNRCQNPEVCRTDVVGNSCQQTYHDYSCDCNAIGFYPGTLIGRDLAPYFTCLSGYCDTEALRSCGTHVEGNVCVPSEGRPSTCICSAPGWSPGPPVAPFGVRSCVQNPCAHDNCATRSSGNMCVNTSLTTYGCSCGNAGWKPGPGKPPQSCLPDPCGLNACRSEVQGNICTDLGQGQFACTCGALCWREEGGRCIAPVNPCAPSGPAQDYCRILESPFNSCKLRFGGYECTCNAPTHEVLHGGLACGPPDRCAQLQETRLWGDSQVCALSSWPDQRCFGQANHTEATSLCASQETRLCTEVEVARGETQGSGCGGDFARIWSSSSCDGGFRSLGGSDLAGLAPQCSPPSTRLAVRCCIDALIPAPPFVCGNSPT